MCGRYGYDGPLDAIEKELQRKIRYPKPTMKANVVIGGKAPIITDKNPDVITIGTFGFTPSWAKKPQYFFNARSEEIVVKPAFRYAIRQQRCLIPATFFIEGTHDEGWKKPFCIKRRDKPVMFFAGIWNEFENPANGELMNTFAIITTKANTILQWVTHERSPVILSDRDVFSYLKTDLHLNAVTRMLQPYDDEKIDAFPINPEACKKGADDLSMLQKPIGASYYQQRNGAYVKKMEEKLQEMKASPERQKGEKNLERWVNYYKGKSS